MPLPFEFHFEGLSNFSASVEGLVQIQEVDSRLYKRNTKLILNLCMDYYMVHVSSTMWISKNQPSNSTSSSHNALHLLVFVGGKLYRGLQVTSSFSIWGCILKGCFESGIILKGQITFEEHWRLESCTPDTMVFPLSLQWGQLVEVKQNIQCREVCLSECSSIVPRPKVSCMRVYLSYPSKLETLSQILITWVAT